MPHADSEWTYIGHGNDRWTFHNTTNTTTYNWPVTLNAYITTSSTMTYTVINNLQPIYTMDDIHHEGHGGGGGATDEQVRQAIVAPEREMRRLYAQREERHRREGRVEANSRAEELLLTMLSEDQAAELRRNDSFTVIGSAGGVYRIRRGVSGNVDWILPDGGVGGVLCAHPTMAEHWLPQQDVAVSQLLALTTDEPSFVRVANVHRGRRPPVAA